MIDIALTRDLIDRLFPVPQDGTLRGHQENTKRGLVKGTVCPCCGQDVKLYRYPINCQMAIWLRVLIHEWKKTRTWVRVSDEPLKWFAQGGNYGKLRAWGLVKSAGGKAKSGRWAPTQVGIDYVENGLPAPKYMYVYNNQIIGVSQKEFACFSDALGTKFDLDEVMSATMEELREIYVARKRKKK